VLAVLLASSLSMTPLAAHADASSDAKAHFNRGVELFGKGSYESSLEEFKTSYRIRAVPVVLFNIAETYTALDRFDDAMTYLGLFNASTPADTLEPAQRDQVQELTARIRKATGTVRVVDAPEGASVAVDGKELPGALARPAYVAAGTHVIAVTHPDFQPWRRSFHVDAGDAAALKAELVPRPRDAQVRVIVSPRDANVSLDGRAPPSTSKKDGTAFVMPVHPGWHEILVSKPGMTSIDTVLELRAGETREVSAELFKGTKPSFLESPWLWAGVGIVVGGFVGYAIAKQ
jgi:hypothetical protein